MWRMLQSKTPADYVIATGVTHTVREFVEAAFSEIGTEILWEGSGVDEVGKDTKTGRVRVRIDERYFRPAEVELLLGDPSRAKADLAWEPSVSFEQLVSMMVQGDLKQQGRDAYLRDGGYEVMRHFE